MHEHNNGAIVLSGALPSPPRPKSLEEQVADQLPQEDAHAAVVICQRLATEPRSVGAIGAAVWGLPDNDAGRHAAQCRFYRLKVASPALTRLYAHARESRADLLVDQLTELADAPLPESPDGMAAKAEVERRKLQIDVRKWQASRFNRGVYADQPERAGVHVTINDRGGASALEEIRQRLARKREALERAKADGKTITVERLLQKEGESE
jgi:terminase small subunit-like protein